MFSRKIFLVLICLFTSFNLFVISSAKSQDLSNANAPISDLDLQYERGIKYWGNGDGRSAFLTLDSLRKIELTNENALVKGKGMIFLAKCFYSQKNYPNTINYLNLALTFGKDTLGSNELISVYDLLSSCYHETHNSNQELYFSQLKKVITDSLQAVSMQQQVDSLKKALEAEKIAKHKRDSIISKESEINNSSISNSTILYGVLGIALILVLGIIILRKKDAPTSLVNKNTSEKIKSENKDIKGANQLIEKIAKVELVFIRAEVLGEYGNKKTVVKIINDYNTQLPLIIKNLDDAITTNDNEPIITALSYLKPYLTAFGMSATLAMLNEVEAESATEKTTKLLSRVFQIRNHIRRAHDETRALIEVLG